MFRKAGSLAVIIAALIGASQLPAHAEILQNTEQYAEQISVFDVGKTAKDILKDEKGRVFDAIKPDDFDERLHSDDDVKPLEARRGINLADGGGITPAEHDVLINDHGICRWIDNEDDKEYFVPKRTAEELAAFIANRPGAVDASNCCPATVVTFEASDGQQRRFKLDIGREGASGPRGTVSLLHVFNLTRAEDGATWQERVSETYICENGAWTGSGAVRTGAAPELVLPKFCGSHLEGESWFEVTANATRAATAAECPAGAGDRALAWNIESEFRCDSGVPTLTGVTHTSGETWKGACKATSPAEIVELPASACKAGNNCQWGANKNRSIAGFNWNNAMYVCAAAGYPYLVAAQGNNGRGDCSHCSWRLWSQNATPLPALADLASFALPAKSNWSVKSQGSWSSASWLTRVWCSNEPHQRLPYHCAPGVQSFSYTAIVGQTCTTKTFKGYGPQTTCTGGTPVTRTFTANMPGAYNAQPDSAGVLSQTIVHPSDTRVPLDGNGDDGRSTLFYRVTDSSPRGLQDALNKGKASRDSLYAVDGTLALENGSTAATSGAFECRADGWHMYAYGCQAATISMGRGGRREMLCLDAPPPAKW